MVRVGGWRKYAMEEFIVTGSAEQFCQIVFDCACVLHVSLDIFYREYVCGASVGSLGCFPVGVPSA